MDPHFGILVGGHVEARLLGLEARDENLNQNPTDRKSRKSHLPRFVHPPRPLEIPARSVVALQLDARLVGKFWHALRIHSDAKADDRGLGRRLPVFLRFRFSGVSLLLWRFLWFARGYGKSGRQVQCGQARQRPDSDWHSVFRHSPPSTSAHDARTVRERATVRASLRRSMVCLSGWRES